MSSVRRQNNVQSDAVVSAVAEVPVGEPIGGLDVNLDVAVDDLSGDDDDRVTVVWPRRASRATRVDDLKRPAVRGVQARPIEALSAPDARYQALVDTGAGVIAIRRGVLSRFVSFVIDVRLISALQIRGQDILRRRASTASQANGSVLGPDSLNSRPT